MDGRSWRWLRARILGLLDLPPIGWRDVTEGKNTRPEPVWGTRVQYLIFSERKGAAA